MKPVKYAVKEVFLTLQGEGLHTGRRAVFVRFAGCNLWNGVPDGRVDGKGACAKWCFAPDEPVLLADWTYAPIGSLTPGQRVMCARKVGNKLRLDTTVVKHVLRRTAPLAKLEFGDGVVVGTSDHPVWRCSRGKNDRAGWVPAEDAIGARVPSLAPPVVVGDQMEWERGWLAGIAFGDGCFWTLRSRRKKVREVPYDRSSPWVEVKRSYRRFRLAMNDEALLKVFAWFASRAGFEAFYEAPHRHSGFGGVGVIPALWCTRHDETVRFEAWLRGDGGEDFAAGFLAGTLDAEGTIGKRSVYLAQDEQANPENYVRIAQALSLLGFDNTPGPSGFNLHTGERERWRFMVRCRPMLERKWIALLGASLERATDVLRAVTPIGVLGEVVSLTTAVGNYILAGHLVKNCDTDFAQGKMVDIDWLAGSMEMLSGEDHRFCVLTGGEPMLQVNRPLLLALRARGWKIAVETNGTRPVQDSTARLIDHICVSPKKPAEGGLPAVASVFSRVDELKLVLPGAQDFDRGLTDEEIGELQAWAMMRGCDRFTVVPQDPIVLRDVEVSLLRRSRELDRDSTAAMKVAEARAMKRCIQFVMANPEWRLGIQAHKYWSMP